MQKLPKFFDRRGELSRNEYFYAGISRGFVFLGIAALNYGLNALWGWDVTFTEESSWEWVFADPLVTVAWLIIFIPIIIRRLNDAGVNLWWAFAFEALVLMPQPPADSEGPTAAYGILVILPYLIWMLLLQFKPGKAYQKWRRQCRSQRSNQFENGRSRVTFSE